MAKFFIVLAFCATSALAGFHQEILDHQNHYRTRHGVAPLKLNKELSDLAQFWADKIASECKMHHRNPGETQYKGKDHGENLWVSSHEPDVSKAAQSAADSWYSEIKDYPFDQGGYDGTDKEVFKKIGHFTQTVWKANEEAGYGIAHNPDCPDFQTYIVGRYWPGGNKSMKGKTAKAYSDNVFPAKD